MTEFEVKINDRKTVFDGHFRIDRYCVQHSLFQGGLGREVVRDVFERGHVTAVLLVDATTDQVVLVEQFRPGALAAGWEPWLLECVAGIIEPDESTADVAIRESREETGCEVAALIPIMRFLTSPGASSETVQLFCGRVDARTAGGIHGLAAEGEDILVHVISVDEALRKLEDGAIVNAKTVIALQWLALHYSELKAQWGTAEEIVENHE